MTDPDAPAEPEITDGSIDVIHDVDHNGFNCYRARGCVGYDGPPTFKDLAAKLGVPVSKLNLKGDSEALLREAERARRNGNRPRQAAPVDPFTNRPEW